MRGHCTTTALLLCLFATLLIVCDAQTLPTPTSVWKGYFTTHYTQKPYPALGAKGQPSGRHAGCMWPDPKGNIWLYAGHGYGSSGGTARLNDVWMFNSTTEEWFFMTGSTAFNQEGTYNGIGKEGIPSSRYELGCTFAPDGTMWFYGGYLPSGGLGGDLWSFNITSLKFTQWYGFTNTNFFGTFPAIGTEGGNPGARFHPIMWGDWSKRIIYVYGGYGYAKSGSQTSISDLWSYDLNTLTWKWERGTDSINEGPTYPASVPGVGFPGARGYPTTCQNRNGTLVYIIGGLDHSWRGDVWVYDVATKNFTLLYKNAESAVFPSPATPGSTTGRPGMRYSGQCWVDGDNNLGLFGGYIWYSGTNYPAADLWTLNVTSLTWTWWSGRTTDTSSQATWPSTAPGPGMPTGRAYAHSSVSKDGNLFLMGGYLGGIGDYVGDQWISQLCSRTYTCNGHGSCNSSLQCTCDVGWTGQFCNISLCTNGYFANVISGCVCYSGWSAFACEGSAGSCPAITPTTGATIAHPVIDTSSAVFANNNLNVKIKGVYVLGRNYTSITFLGSNSSQCSIGMPKSYWAQNFTDCKDEFTLTLPWKNRASCGFTVYSSDETYVEFVGLVRLSYTDPLVFNVTNMKKVLRASDSTFSLHVNFPRTVTVHLESMNVTSNSALDAALTKELYDSNTGVLTLVITTSMLYSHTMSDVPPTIEPPAGITLQNVTMDNTQCTQLAGSICVQHTIIKVTLADPSTCVFDGSFFFKSVSYSCRETNKTTCTSTPIEVTFTLSSGSVCPTVNLHPSVTGQLKTFKSNDFVSISPTTNFAIGDKIYFYADLNTGVNNYVDLTFVDISFSTSTGDLSPTYLMQGKNITSSGVSSTLTVVGEQKYFFIFLTGLVFKGSDLSSYKFTAKCSIVFPGSKKREIDVRFAPFGGLSENDNGRTQLVSAYAKVDVTHHRVVNNNNKCDNVGKDREQTHHSTSESGVSVTLVAGLVGVIIAAVVVMVGNVMFMRKIMLDQQRYSPVPQQ